MHRLRNTLSHAGLKQKLTLVFVLLVVLVSLVLSVVSMSLFARKTEEKNARYISDITYQTVNNIEMLTADLEEITFAVLSSNLVQEQLRRINRPDTPNMQVLAASNLIDRFLSIYTLYNVDIVSLSVFPLRGDEIVSTPFLTEPTKVLFVQDDIFAANGSSLWGIVPEGEHEICVARAILDLTTQKPIGYVNLVVRQRFIGAVMEDITISYASGSYMLDEAGRVISSNLPHMVGKRLEGLAGRDSGFSVFDHNFEGTPSSIYQGKRMDNGWTLMTVIPKNELQREAVWFYTMLALVDLLVIIVAVAAVWFLVRRITSPFDRLCRSMEEVGKGHFDKRELIETHDEVGMLSRSYNQMVDNIETLIEQVYQLQISNQQSELEFLKMQINPHFLYNTLDTISWMARIEQKDDIAKVTMALGNLLRGTLKQEDTVTVAREVDNIRNYLLIQQYRFGEKLSWKLCIDEACEELYIPSFILQPLVENAIIHGLEPKETHGTVTVEVCRSPTHAEFSVSDDGMGMSFEQIQQFNLDMLPSKGNASIGMQNVNRRLQLYFGREAALHVRGEKQQGTRIWFHIPLERCRKPDD